MFLKEHGGNLPAPRGNRRVFANLRLNHRGAVDRIVLHRDQRFVRLIQHATAGAARAPSGLGYWMMTMFMLQGVRVRVRGKVCAPMVVVFGGAQVLVPTGSGGVPFGEPDRS